MNIMNKDEENFEDELRPIVFVAISPISVKSEELDDEQGVSLASESCFKSSFEEYPDECVMNNVVNVKKEWDCRSEYQMKMQIKQEIDDCELDLKVIENSSIKAIENSSDLDIVSIGNEMKHLCEEMTATEESNVLMNSHYKDGILNNQNVTFEKTPSTVNVEHCFFKGTEDFAVKVESIYDQRELDLKEEKPFETGLDIDNIEDDSEPSSSKEGHEIFEHGAEESSFIDYVEDVNRGSVVSNRCGLKLKKMREVLDMSNTSCHGETGKDNSECGSSRIQMEPTEDENKLKKRSFKCLKCDAVFTSKLMYNHHRVLYSKHGVHLCISKFPNRTGSYIHVKKQTVAVEKPFSCGMCEASFSLKSILKLHMGTHTGEKPFSCDLCEATFHFNCDLRKHMRTHSSEKSYSCVICKLSFNHKHRFKEHLRTHTGERPFSCGICEASFSRNASLTIHKRIHTNEKPFSCGICQASFRRKCSLTEHIRIHTGDKPFTCVTCRASFSQKSSLRRHMRTHARLKAVSCGNSVATSGNRKSLG